MIIGFVLYVALVVIIIYFGFNSYKETINLGKVSSVSEVVDRICTISAKMLNKEIDYLNKDRFIYNTIIENKRLALICRIALIVYMYTELTGSSIHDEVVKIFKNKEELGVYNRYYAIFDKYIKNQEFLSLLLLTPDWIYTYESLTIDEHKQTYMRVALGALDDMADNLYTKFKFSYTRWETR